MWYAQRRNGYILFLGVLVVGAISVSILVSTLLLGLGSSRSSFAFEQSVQAGALAQACVEEGLEQVRTAASFTGSGSLTLGAGTCSYTVTSQGGSARTIVTSGTAGEAVRRVQVSIDQINPTIRVVSWQEI